MVADALALASLVALGFEKPVLAWRRRLLGRGPAVHGGTVLAAVVEGSE